MQNYDYGSNGLYFVTVCVKDKKPILSRVVGDDAHIVPYKTGYCNSFNENSYYKRNRIFNMAKVIFDEVIRDEKHFQSVWNYIEYNALKEYK